MGAPTSKDPDTVEKSQSDEKVSTTSEEKSNNGVLKSLTPLAMPLAVALVGILGSMYLADRQETETNLRLYTELMSKREEADTSLRKEMFNSIITNFLKREAKDDPAKEVLNLELLAYNFHDSLDLAPLFKDVYKKLSENRERNQIYIDRLNKVARDVTAKQTAMLEEAGGKLDGTVVLEELKTKSVVMDESISLKATDPQGKVTAIVNQKIRIEVLEVRPEKKELEVRLIARNPRNNDEREATFAVNYFDFPMIDNVRLPENFRCAIVLNDFDEDFAAFTFVYFPSSRASLKEKPYYDEILYKLRGER